MNEKKMLYECVRCGNCCKWPGPVWLGTNEINDIARFLKISIEDFIDKYTRLVAHQKALSLMEKPDGSCIFLKNNRCMINDVKPKQCKDFPDNWNFEGFEQLCNAKIISNDKQKA